MCVFVRASGVPLSDILTIVLMKSTKVQTLGAVTLRATTACTDDANIVSLGPLNMAIA